MTRCKDCPPPTTRPANHPGPRCATHHRAAVSARKEAARGRHLETTYNITAEQYEAIKTAQGGVCAICQRANGRTKALAVDHNHETGEVRGVLCGPCNRGVLGHLRDSPDAMERAAEYLRNPPARQILRSTEDE